MTDYLIHHKSISSSETAGTVGQTIESSRYRRAVIWMKQMTCSDESAQGLCTAYESLSSTLLLNGGQSFQLQINDFIHMIFCERATHNACLSLGHHNKGEGRLDAIDPGAGDVLVKLCENPGPPILTFFPIFSPKLANHGSKMPEPFRWGTNSSGGSPVCLE